MYVCIIAVAFVVQPVLSAHQVRLYVYSYLINFRLIQNIIFAE